MMNFGYHTDDVMDSAGIFWEEPDDFSLVSVESISDSLESFESDEELTDLDEQGEFLMEDIMSNYEIYNRA
jgi:hypothetical protein